VVLVVGWLDLVVKSKGELLVRGRHAEAAILPSWLAYQHGDTLISIGRRNHSRGKQGTAICSGQGPIAIKWAARITGSQIAAVRLIVPGRWWEERLPLELPVQRVWTWQRL